ncbi:hypothetical protein KJS94_09745 [Flavihumibacter rivuli]|uniref:glycoside hydrolase family 31 protein n=1 Tax=Flavihumibacter rivuli TaxID=2838156 RepID=UPI001BDF49FA|nr:TIM-barrel domain-containing protein [Flavihumibacter rivuli]ULQ54920.1 hypothetical protein KJS94_09745 [Flavihumibacter rivuli]
MRLLPLLFLLLHCLPIIAQQKASTAPASLVIPTRAGKWTLQSYDEQILRIRFTPEERWFNAQLSDAVIARPSTKPIVRNTIDGEQFLFAGDIRVQVDEGAEQLLLKANDSSEAITIQAFRYGPNAGFRISLQEGEMVFGGGERAINMDRRGYRLPLYNAPAYGYEEGAENLNFSIPLFYSSKGHALFFDNPSSGYVDVGKSDPSLLEAGFSSGELNCYFIAGKTIDEMLQSYTRLTGKAPLPPRWALGNFMSRFGYQSESQLMAIVDSMRKYKIPMDAVILDLFWFGDSIKGTLGNLDWVNSSKWPNPKRMMDTLEARSIKTILITEPFFLQGTRNYDASLKFLAVDSSRQPYMLKDLYFGYGGLIDLFRKDARDWFWTKYDKQIKLGVDGWWGDLGEPEKHPADLYHNGKDLGVNQLLNSNQVHNLYGHYWSKMLYEKYKQFYPQQRLFYLNRSGFAGSQRYSVFPWTGDVSRSWSGLRAQLPLLQSMSICGIPYIHSDAGGFAGGDEDPELYLRWLQFAIFTPIFRPHGTALGQADPQARSYPSEPALWPDSVREIAKQYVQTRYDLVPYNYNLSYEQSKYGKPMMRPMFYYDLADSNLVKAQDQYMWGDAILVAPVLEKGATKRRLYLPKGNWYDSRNKKKYEGGQWLEVPVYIDRIPVFVKAGSFVPTRAQLSNISEYKTRLLVTQYFFSPEGGKYMLYDDDGKDPRAMETNNHEMIGFVARSTHTGMEIRIGSGSDRYTGRATKRFMVMDIFGLPADPKSVKVDGLLAPLQSKFQEIEKYRGQIALWDPLNGMLRVVFEFTGTSQKLEVSF